MKVLITGSKGFVGKNLIAVLNNIKNGNDKIRKIKNLKNSNDLEILSYDIDSNINDFENYCQQADFVYHLAGVNRPKTDSEFMQGNFGFSSTLLNTLKKYKNTCPVMLSSSIQASLMGRYATSDYGKSKVAGEQLFFEYSKETGAKVLVYRFPNLFGKWCRPNYNSVIATFCYNLSHDKDIQVNNDNEQLELLYIDDLIDELIFALNGNEHRCDFNGIDAVANVNGKFCYAPGSHSVTLGEVVSLLQVFKDYPSTLTVPNISEDSFAKKLLSTYISYLPIEKTKLCLKTNEDNKGSFTEVLKTVNSGQFSVNISKPGITKGNHWHNSKWEQFIVVSGRGLIQQRNLNSGEIIEIEVSGEKLEVVFILSGYAHNIINLSDTEDLITLMWANEAFDLNKPDTYYERVLDVHE